MIEELKSLVEAVSVWPTILAAILLFSLAPGLVLHLAVLLYPKGHPRRAELLAELKVVPRWERPFWVAEALPAPLFEGLPARLRARQEGRRAAEVPVGYGQQQRSVAELLKENGGRVCEQRGCYNVVPQLDRGWGRTYCSAHRAAARQTRRGRPRS